MSDGLRASGRRVVYLARHGETEWNRAGRWQGHTDIPLTPLGRQQAAQLALRLGQAGLEHVIASDLSRARDTARIVADALGLDVAYEDPDLRERMFGIFEGLTRAQCQTEHAQAWLSYEADRATGPTGAETHQAVATRMLRAMKRALALSGQGGVLLVTHGSAMRILGNALGDVGSDPIGNGQLLRIDLDAGEVVSVARMAAQTDH
jgi:broad specificity phosphatase PhoE